MYKLILICLLLSFFSCKKDPLENTSKLAGNHSWEGVRTVLHIINNGADTILLSAEPVQYEKNITVLSRNIIYFFSDSMFLTSVNNKNNIIMYTREDNYMYPYRYTRDTFIFNYVNSLIEFKRFTRNNNHIYKTDIFSLK